MTEPGPNGCPADGHASDDDFAGEEDEAALVIIPEDVGSTES